MTGKEALTPALIHSTPAGRDLDVLVAWHHYRRVWGWSDGEFSDFYCHAREWSTRIGEAMGVAEDLRTMGWLVTIKLAPPGHYFVDLARQESEGGFPRRSVHVDLQWEGKTDLLARGSLIGYTADTIPEAICKAALSAVLEMKR